MNDALGVRGIQGICDVRSLLMDKMSLSAQTSLIRMERPKPGIPLNEGPSSEAIAPPPAHTAAMLCPPLRGALSVTWRSVAIASRL
jgi:hypothetical protein